MPKPKPLELRALILCLLTRENTLDTVCSFDPQITHICVQWQVVFKHIHDLNNLLSEPFAPLPPVSAILDGQLLHSLISGMHWTLNNDDNMLKVYKVNATLFYRLVSVTSDEACNAPKKQHVSAHQGPISESLSEPSLSHFHTGKATLLHLTQSSHHHQTQSRWAKKQKPKSFAPPSHCKRLASDSSRSHQPRSNLFHALPICICLFLIFVLYYFVYSTSPV